MLQPKLLKPRNLHISKQELNKLNTLDRVLLQWKNSNYASKLQEMKVQMSVKDISKPYNNVRHKTRITSNLHENY